MTVACSTHCYKYCNVLMNYLHPLYAFSMSDLLQFALRPAMVKNGYERQNNHHSDSRYIRLVALLVASFHSDGGKEQEKRFTRTLL